MNKKAEGEIWLLLILVALIPMCSHSGETSYSQCLDDCKEINYNTTLDGNWSRHWYQNDTEISSEVVKDFCYNQCKLNERYYIIKIVKIN